MNKSSNKYQVIGIYLALSLSTLAVYWQVHKHEFVNYDDAAYVYKNPLVTSGITRQSVIWAFTTSHQANWHPLTWLSHMLDCEIYGLNAGGHHLTGVLLHTANTLLLFWVFKRMTGALWRSAFVGAAFALHPLHVDSVAWIAERKDVLSTFFWILTMVAYVRYVKNPRRVSYTLALAAFAFGLMAKPMLVTLPFVLLLLDYWPLNRFEGQEAANGRFQRDALWRLVREKIPFFALSAVSSTVTFFVQRTGGGVVSTETFPVIIRIGNSFLTYLRYIAKMFWPGGLAVFYPHWGNKFPLWEAAASAVLLLGISVWVVRLSKGHKYLAVGWLWYIGTLVPVIGLVQVGGQAMADRYTYVPLTGLFIIIGWGVPDLLERWRYRTVALWVLTPAVLLALSICSYYQTRHWRNSITLFEHALAVTAKNYVAHFCITQPLIDEGKINEAIYHAGESVRIKPDFIEGHNALGLAFLGRGRCGEAARHFTIALKLKPDCYEARVNLGTALADQGKLDEAVKHYSLALQQKDLAEVRTSLAGVLLEQGKIGEAIAHYTEAVRLRPSLTGAANSLAWLLATHKNSNIHNPSEAVRLAEQTCKLSGCQNPRLLDTLAAAYASAGRFSEAAATAEKAIELARLYAQNELADKIENRLRLYRSSQPYLENGKESGP